MSESLDEKVYWYILILNAIYLSLCDAHCLSKYVVFMVLIKFLVLQAANKDNAIV